MSDSPAATVFHYAQIDWDDPGRGGNPAVAPPKELVEQAKKTGARRKKLVQGEGGFFMNRSFLPAGFRVPPHTHDHDEMLVVLKGGCSIDGSVGELEADDTVVIRANHSYGFTCGPEGMEFLTIRRGEAKVDLTPAD